MIKKTLNQDTNRDIDTSMNTLSKVIQKAARETVEQREREKYGVALGKDDATQYVRNVKLTFYGDIVRERINSKTKQKEKVDKVDIFVKEGISLRQAIQRAQISKNAASYEIIESYFIKNYNGTIERIGTTGEIKVTYDMYGTEIYIPNKSEDTSSGEKTIYDNKPGAVAKFEDLIRANRSTINMTLNKFMEEKEEVTSLIDIATKPPIQRAFLLKLKKDLRRTELASDENEQDLLYFVSTIHKPNENPIYNTLNTSVKDQLERRLNEKAAKLANEKIEMVHKSSRIIETDDLAANTSVADEIAKREVQRIEAQNRANQEDEKNRIIEELLTDMRERALIEAGSSNNQEQKKHKEMPLD
jgi:hypothetical protein